MAKVQDSLLRPLAARAVEGNPQEHTFLGRTDRTLALLNLQLQVVLEKPSQTSFDAFTGARACDDEEKVGALASEPGPASFQFLIQVV